MAAAIAAIVAAALVALAAILLPPAIQRRRRRHTAAQSLSASQRACIARNVPCADSVPDGLRVRFEGLVRTFLAEKEFVGCNGLVITDEIRVTIAAHACLLLLGRPGRIYDELRSILVYPSTFWVNDEVEDEAGIVMPRRRELSGESWDSHRIILSWEDVAESGAMPADGYNVVLHEFAHYLEAEGLGLAAGQSAAMRTMSSWLAELRAEYARFVGALEHDDAVFLDPYAAEDEAEFFAVSTEDFIERPRSFREASPAHYRLLTEYYGIDPASWQGTGRFVA